MSPADLQDRRSVPGTTTPALPCQTYPLCRCWLAHPAVSQPNQGAHNVLDWSLPRRVPDDGRLVQKHNGCSGRKPRLPASNHGFSLSVISNLWRTELLKRPVVRAEDSDDRTGVGGGPRRVEPNDERCHARREAYHRQSVSRAAFDSLKRCGTILAESGPTFAATSFGFTLGD